MELVESSVQRSLLDERSNPHRSYSSLARISRNMGVDKILTHFPAERREELTSLPPEHLAAEYIQETALQLAGAKLKSAGGSSDKLLIEEDVVRVLARSLLATQMADRLLTEGVYVIGFSYPVVPKGEARIRVQVSAAHSKDQLSRAASGFEKVGRELGIIS